ncbi:uncharacterized protein [Parasteatoda tepidariorum]|uniref:uncharacterized protein isoform X3 n=1 Tax=Parasteatoda tepidariorum TaxID=114398 RepID=UPI001C726F06|nr:uncharacterized protein LOC107440974 isoform X3 [Parasteatoda tepidariorum]
MASDLDNYQTLIEATNCRDSKEVLRLLNENIFSVKDGRIFRFLCDSENEANCLQECHCSKKERDIIYMLIDSGFNIEELDEKGNTCLFYAVKNNHSLLCDVLLQCGANMWANTEPGVWKAVEWENIYQVRKLVNLWCRTDLYQDGVSLKNIALKTGHEEIISLILGIFETMKIIHHILAQNIKAVSELLEKCHNKIRLDLRKMSDRGAPILYYLIKSGDVGAIELFIKYGCHLYTIMQDDIGFDMPVLFSALKPRISPEVIRALLPPDKPYQEEMLFKILYRGKTVLEIALMEKVGDEVFKILIDRGGPLLLCERNQMNQTIRDLALLFGDTRILDAIDEVVMCWIVEPERYHERRKKLALYGWDLETVKDRCLEKSTEDYFGYVKNLQSGIKALSIAVEAGDVEKYLQLKNTLSALDAPELFLWQAKVVGDGMPLLHKAVLHNRFEIVTDILLEKPCAESIDNLFDQNRRTALHYAYANSELRDIRALLMTYGCSEHVLDKAYKEPLDFREKQDTQPMLELLDRLKLKTYLNPECDPWSFEIRNDDDHPSITSSRCSEREDDDASESEEEDTVSEEEEETTRSFCLIS